PQFSQNSIEIVNDARENGATTVEEIIQYVVNKIKNKELDWAIENPNDPRNFPRVFFNWRSNLLGDSGKGHEYFVKHLIGGDDQVHAKIEESWNPETINMDDLPPEG